MCSELKALDSQTPPPAYVVGARFIQNGRWLRARPTVLSCLTGIAPRTLSLGTWHNRRERQRRMPMQPIRTIKEDSKKAIANEGS